MTFQFFRPTYNGRMALSHAELSIEISPLSRNAFIYGSWQILYDSPLRFLFSLAPCILLPGLLSSAAVLSDTHGSYLSRIPLVYRLQKSVLAPDRQCSYVGSSERFLPATLIAFANLRLR